MLLPSLIMSRADRLRIASHQQRGICPQMVNRSFDSLWAFGEIGCTITRELRISHFPPLTSMTYWLYKSSIRPMRVLYVCHASHPSCFGVVSLLDPLWWSWAGVPPGHMWNPLQHLTHSSLIYGYGGYCEGSNFFSWGVKSGVVAYCCTDMIDVEIHACTCILTPWECTWSNC